MIHDPKTMLPIAYHAAAEVVRNQLFAEEAGERAFHQLTLAVLTGHAPAHPKAWLRSVARRTAYALLKSAWGRTKTVANEDLPDRQAPYHQPREVGIEQLRESLGPRLTAPHNQALAAVGQCNGTRAAARSCGMAPRDFRRHLVAITRKARSVMQHDRSNDPFANDPRVLFELDT